MNRDSTFHVSVFLMAVLIFSMPFSTLAQQQQNTVAEAEAQAIADAKADTDKASWFMGGCFLNIFGIVVAKLSTAPVPADRLVGKSPDYVAIYTLSYQAEQTRIRVRSALQGCIVGFGICVGVFFIAVSGDGGSGWCSPFL